MQLHVRSWTEVTIASLATCAISITATFVLVLGFFQGEDLNAALSFGPLIAFIITFPASFFIWAQVRRNSLLSDELRRLVNRDKLTDMATRDYFFTRMNSNPQAYGVSLMVDIDFFKAVNDTYGHFAGDAVIARVAGVLFRNTRETDIVCRFGGEEFVVFLHNHDMADGFQTAERMRRAIASEVISFDGVDMQVTVSIGGSLKDRLRDINKAIKEADAALYRAKEAGRNRTVFAPETIDVSAKVGA